MVRPKEGGFGRERLLVAASSRLRSLVLHKVSMVLLRVFAIPEQQRHACKYHGVRPHRRFGHGQCQRHALCGRQQPRQLGQVYFRERDGEPCAGFDRQRDLVDIAHYHAGDGGGYDELYGERQRAGER